MVCRIPVAEPDIGEEELQNVTEAVKSGWISSKGAFIDEFELDFARYIGTKHGVATSNGTAALHLALETLGIGKGDKVIVPSLTFIAVANAVAYTGAKPVFVDSHPEYWCINPSEIKKKIDSRTKAIIVVHLYGHPCNMDEIMTLAEDHDLYVVEDCAEAHGAEYKDRKVGSFGVISCFSFYGNKVITTGEGGMCLTNHDELDSRMRILRDHGMSPGRKYWHEVIGFNYRMTNLQAAVGVAQLHKIGMIIEKKRQIASLYGELLKNLPDITSMPEMPWAKSVFWLYSVLIGNSLREKVSSRLLKKGIETRPFFYPIPTMPPFKSCESFPCAEALSAHGLNLPSSSKLSDIQIQDITAEVRAALK